MKIAILSTADVANWYWATLQERGHNVMAVDGQTSNLLACASMITCVC
jgi:hypothetical protein